MDSKKTNLTPELKEIYDRVMNTPGSAAPAAKDATPTPPTPTVPNPLDVSGAAKAPTAPEIPAAPPTPVASLPNIGGPQPLPAAQQAPTESLQMPALPSTEPTPAEQALTSTPARPLSEGNTFTFNGSKTPPSPTTPSAKADKKGKKISLPILIALGVIFIAVWGVFWGIILGLIKT